MQRLARGVSLIRKLDDQDRIFSSQPDQRHQPNLKINVIGQPPSPDGQQRSQYSKRYRKDDRKGMDQLSYNAASTRKTMSKRKGKHQDGLSASLAFLERYPAPVDRIPFRNQDFIRYLLQRVKRLSRAVARGGASQYERGIEAIEMRNGSGPLLNSVVTTESSGIIACSVPFRARTYILLISSGLERYSGNASVCTR